MAKREEMLRAVRNALKRQADEPPFRPDRSSSSLLENVMPAIPAEEMLERFEAEFKALGCKAYRASQQAELESIFQSILTESNVQTLVLSRNPLLAQLRLAEVLRQWGKKVAEWPGSMVPPAQQAASPAFREDCFKADAGVTGVDFALAETGSFVLTSFTEGSQLASLVPPIHIVLYRRSQVRASLDEVLQNLPISCDPSRPSPARSVVFVTGSSRTADIEQILIRGVHGPGMVHAILVEESCLAG